MQRTASWPKFPAMYLSRCKLTWELVAGCMAALLSFPPVTEGCTLTSEPDSRARLIVNCNENPTTLIWESDFPADSVRFEAICSDSNASEVLPGTFFSGFDFPQEGTVDLSSILGKECEIYGCIANAEHIFSREYRSNDVMSCPMATVAETTEPSTEMATSAEVTTMVTTVTPDPDSSTSKGSTIAQTLDAHREETLQQGVSVWIKTVPVLVLLVLLLCVTAFTGLFCLLSVRRRNARASSRLFVGEYEESPYRRDEDGIEDGFISSLGMVPLHSVSTSSVFTLLDTLTHTSLTAYRYNPNKPATGQFTVTLRDSLNDSDEDVRNRLSGGSLTEGLSPRTCPLSDVDQPVVPRRHSLGHEVLVEDCKVVWSDLDMTCFSESDSEQFNEDRESKSYFKVENLENYQIGGLESNTVTHVDSGCHEGSGCGTQLSDVGGIDCMENSDTPPTDRGNWISAAVCMSRDDQVGDMDLKLLQNGCLHGEEETAGDSGFKEDSAAN